MPGRRHAQIFTRIWDDEDFVSLPPSEQRLYLLLVSQRNLNYAGVVPLTERRWARYSSQTGEQDIRDALDGLAHRRYVVVDTQTQELLVRSFVRNDEVWKQPKLLTLALREALDTTSQELRSALSAELHRVAELIMEGLRRHPGGLTAGVSGGVSVPPNGAGPVHSVDRRLITIEQTRKALMGGPGHTPGDTPPEGYAQGLARAPPRGTRSTWYLDTPRCARAVLGCRPKSSASLRILVANEQKLITLTMWFFRNSSKKSDHRPRGKLNCDKVRLDSGKGSW